MRRLLCVYLAVSLSCRATTPPVTAPKPVDALPTGSSSKKSSPPTVAGGRRIVPLDAPIGGGNLSVELVDGAALTSPAVESPMTADETKALLARLEPLPDLSAQNAKAPTLRAPSPPPPRAGSVQPIAFAIVRGKPAQDPGDPTAPPPVKPVPPPPAPLVAPEITPSGEVDKETEIRIRFSDAMVPVAAVGTNDKPAATITPAVAGTWRWIDSRVVTFTSKAAYFANATEYVVTVPAGTKSLAGGELAAPAEMKFRTRPITVTGVFPNNARLRPDSAVVVQLDQAFDPKAIQPFLRVMHAKRSLPYRIVTLAEAEKSWAKNSVIHYDPNELPKLLGKNHLIIAPVDKWPAGVEPQVALAKKAPSKEGPLLSVRESYTSFAVAAAFRVEGVSCIDRYDPRMQGQACPMRSFAEVHFSNPIDLDTYRSSKVQFEGEPFDDHDLSGSSVSILVPDGVGRTINVAIAGDLVDVFGQPLIGARRPGFTIARQRFTPFLSTPSGLVIMDARWDAPQWIVRAEEVTALHVQIFQVKPSDYLAFEAFERKERATPPGKLVLDKFYPVGARHGATLRTDLKPHLGANGTGHLIAVVHAAPTQPRRDWTPKTAAWFQVTKLAATARTDGDHLNAFVHDVTPGGWLKPVDKANVSIVVEGRTDTKAAATDANGHVEMDLLGPGPKWTSRERGPTVMMQVTRGDDTVFSPFRGRHERAQRSNEARWYVTDDRFTYKPGEKVYLKGWVRWTHSGLNPDLALPAPTDTVGYTLTDERGNKIANGNVTVSDNGGFDLEVDLPANANQGTATFTFSTKSSSIRHPISIQEFRRPAYAVNLNEDVTHSGATHVVVGEALEMNASAKYYAGGGLPGATVEWRGELDAATYSPPGWSAYTFNPAAPNPRSGQVAVDQQTELSGDSSSTAIFGITQVVAHRPSLLSVDATVTDVDRMTIRASSRPILVHPSSIYVGSRLAPRTYDTLELIVTDIDGNPVPGVAIDVDITAVLGSERGRDNALTVDTQHCAVKSAAAAVTCKINRKNVEWVYTTVANVKDKRERTSFTVLDLPWYGWEREAEITLVPDKKLYRVGDVAKVEIKSKNSTNQPAIAMVSFARQGVISQKRIALKTESTFIEVPIEPGFLQNVHVLVDRVADKRYRNGNSSKLPTPEVLSAQVDLPVDVESARLSMRTRALTPLVEPGDKATFEVEVTHEGKPKANAEVALIVVDEAVLALSGKSHADPLAPFYREVGDGTTQFDSVDLLSDDGDQLAGKAGFDRYSLDERGYGLGGQGYGSGAGSIGSGRYGTIGHGSGSSIVVSRKDFRATAAFSPRLKTDANGKVRLTVTMPDSLTRFRIVALATADTRWFGKAESAIVTQRKVNARTVAPRFLSQGDKFSLPVVVQNLDIAPRTIEVAARAANLVAIGPQGKRVTLQGGQRAEVRFDFTTHDRGRAVVQTIAVSGSFADASNMDIPVYVPATTEAFATYGIVDSEPKFERLEVPADIFPDVGGVEVEMASTQLQSLTDAYWYLYEYPFECAEQRSSRMIATTAMADILEAFANPSRPTKQEIEETARHDLKKLAKDQNRDGGWGYFDGMRSDPFVTAQVLVALAGHKPDPAMLARAIKFVTGEANASVGKLEAAAAKAGIDRKDRSQHAYWVSLAAATFTALAAVKVDVRARAEKLHATALALGAYPVDAKARLLSLVAKLDRAKPMRQKLVADILSASHETAAAATIATAFEENERALLVSNNKTTALALDALMREVPDHALIPKLARGVLDARNRGRWTSTQENLVVLQTMRRYFDTYEKETPNYTGKLWFGSAAYAEQAFVGRSTVRSLAQVDWDRLPAKTGHDLAVQKAGPGRMYYRIGIVYAPKNVNLPALDAGFVVRRTYEGIDNPADVAKLPDGRIKVRLGARVRVTLEAINTTRRHAVALVDPLPAGFEAVNETLVTSERVRRVQPDAQWDFRAHRDTRVEAFRMELEAGRHRYTYMARATTPGSFIAAPTKAEEMYSPETFGRSTGASVVIE